MAKPVPEVRFKIDLVSSWFNTRLWRRWVVANAAGEFVGLGLASLLGIALAVAVASLTGSVAPIMFAAGMVALGTFEGAIVGAAQSFVLREPLPVIRQRTWIIATAIGAFIAWFLGMIPSTFIAFGEADSGPAEPAMSPYLYFGLAAGMGAVLGVILAVPQWIILRRFVAKAAIWIPANAVAWSFAMPIIFLAASSAPEGGFGVISVLLIAGSVTAAGAVVGAIHGVALSWLIYRR
jgi:hypothetical protein